MFVIYLTYFISALYNGSPYGTTVDTVTAIAQMGGCGHTNRPLSTAQKFHVLCVNGALDVFATDGMKQPCIFFLISLQVVKLHSPSSHQLVRALTFLELGVLFVQVINMSDLPIILLTNPKN